MFYLKKNIKSQIQDTENISYQLLWAIVFIRGKK